MKGCVHGGHADAECQGKRLPVRLLATTASMQTASQSAYQTSFGLNKLPDLENQEEPLYAPNTLYTPNKMRKIFNLGLSKSGKAESDTPHSCTWLNPLLDPPRVQERSARGSKTGLNELQIERDARSAAPAAQVPCVRVPRAYRERTAVRSRP